MTIEFAGKKCPHCDTELGGEEPKKVTALAPANVYVDLLERAVEFVGPCPSCGKGVPLWMPDGDMVEFEPKPEPAKE